MYLQHQQPSGQHLPCVSCPCNHGRWCQIYSWGQAWGCEQQRPWSCLHISAFPSGIWHTSELETWGRNSASAASPCTHHLGDEINTISKAAWSRWVCKASHMFVKQLGWILLQAVCRPLSLTLHSKISIDIVNVLEDVKDDERDFHNIQYDFSSCLVNCSFFFIVFTLPWQEIIIIWSDEVSRERLKVAKYRHPPAHL